MHTGGERDAGYQPNTLRGKKIPGPQRAAAEGQAVGVDLSAAMLRQAARRAQQEGLTNVHFEHGDAQVYGFTPGAADVAVSRRVAIRRPS
jgi:ubiquinone/menaquinone biosynthesis C-methylase UbiE